MPVLLAAHTKFKWLECDTTGLPLAAVASYGDVAYVLTCPLCSHMHELRPAGKHGTGGASFKAVGDEATITPRCLVREYAAQVRTHGQTAPWLNDHPVAADHTDVRCVYVGAGADLKGGYPCWPQGK